MSSRLKVFSCRHPDVQDTTACHCSCCPCYQAKRRGPFPLRDLAYFVCPVEGAVWRTNVEQLLARWDLFTGRKVVAVATGGPVECKRHGRRERRPLESAGAAKEMFAGRDVVFLEVENLPARREGVALVPMLEELHTSDPSRALFMAHAKGVTYPADESPPVHRWAGVMYEALLDFWPLVESVLAERPTAGCFKVTGGALGVEWHYSGSFSWTRSSDLFSRPWRTVGAGWWAFESYLGKHFRTDEAGVVFHEGRWPQTNLYQETYWRERVSPAWNQWRQENQHLRRAPCADSSNT